MATVHGCPTSSGWCTRSRSAAHHDRPAPRWWQNPVAGHQFPTTCEFARAAGIFAIGGNMHRRIVEVGSIFLAVALTSALGCNSTGREAAVKDSSAPAANASASTPAEIKLAGDFQGPLGVQLYSFRDAFKAEVPGTLARVRALGFKEVELAGTYG